MTETNLLVKFLVKKIENQKTLDVRHNVRHNGSILCGGVKVTIINVTNARQNLYQLIADVNANSEPVTIVNNKGENAVLISEDDWRAIEETIYLNNIPHMAESIIEGAKEPLSECRKYESGEEW